MNFVKEEHSQKAAIEYQMPPVDENPQSYNASSRKDTIGKSQYLPPPMTNSRRQLAAQNARIKQQPTKLVYHAPSPEVAGPVDLLEVESYTNGEPREPFDGSMALPTKEEYLQRQTNAHDPFETEFEEGFDDSTTTLSHDIQLKDSQSQYAPLTNIYPLSNQLRGLHDANDIYGIPKHVDGHEASYVGFMAAGTRLQYDLSEGGEFSEEEEGTEGDESGGEPGAEDERTLDSAKLSGFIPPHEVREFQLFKARQNITASHQQFLQPAIEDNAFSPTFDAEEDEYDDDDEENFNPTGKLPFRKAISPIAKVVYRPKPNDPSLPENSIGKATGATLMPTQQLRVAYEADSQSAQGMDMVLSSLFSEANGRGTKESLRVPIPAMNAKAAKKRPLKMLHHEPMVEVDRQRSVKSQETPSLCTGWNNTNITPNSLPAIDPNDISSVSPSHQLMLDVNVLPTCQDQPVRELLYQSHVISASGQKRTVELDYTEEQLSGMSYEKLRVEGFDHNPTGSVQVLPEEIRSETLAKQFKCIKDMIDPTDAERKEKLQSFFSSLSIEEYEECGDLILEQFSSILAKFKVARQEKRKIARIYEEEISQREQTIRGRSVRVDNEMGRIRQAGKDLLNG